MDLGREFKIIDILASTTEDPGYGGDIEEADQHITIATVKIKAGSANFVWCEVIEFSSYFPYGRDQKRHPYGQGDELLNTLRGRTVQMTFEYISFPKTLDLTDVEDKLIIPNIDRHHSIQNLIFGEVISVEPSSHSPKIELVIVDCGLLLPILVDKGQFKAGDHLKSDGLIYEYFPDYEPSE